MESPETTPIVIERPRISIIQRLLASLALSWVALCGGIAALFVIQAMNGVTAAQSGSAGIGGIASALGYASTAVTSGILLGGFLVFAAIVTFVIMLFPTRTTANPPGIYIFILAILSLLPTLFSLPVAWKLIFAPLSQEDIRPQIPFYYLLQYAGILISLVTIAAGLAFSFLPLSAKHGKKFGAIAVMALYLIALIVIKAVMSYELYQMTNIGRY